MKVISLFTGAGGLDLGLEAAGFDIAVCVENDSDSKRSLKKNRPRWKLMEPGDIHQHSPQEILQAAQIRPREAYVLSAGPPCQPFSKAAMWANCQIPGYWDARGRILKAMMRVIAAALPRFIILENVEALGQSGKNGGFRMLRRGMENINRLHGTKYRWNVLNINAADYGVPQVRKRLFFIADREGRTFLPPGQTHFPPRLGQYGGTYATAWQAIGDLDTKNQDPRLSPRGKWRDLIASIPEGHNYLWHTSRGAGLPLFGWRTRYWSFLLKLDKNRPSWTIPASPGPATGPFHWANRMLSIRELLRLQAFPDDYDISGSYLSGRRQIGNAVPPLVAEVLGLEIRRQWLGDRIEHKFVFLPRRVDKKPTHSRVHRVPEKFLELAGIHRDHPGHGRGPRAMRQKEEQASREEPR